MATTDRDAYLWRMWGDAADRPLVAKGVYELTIARRPAREH